MVVHVPNRCWDHITGHVFFHDNRAVRVVEMARVSMWIEAGRTMVADGHSARESARRAMRHVMRLTRLGMLLGVRCLGLMGAWASPMMAVMHPLIRHSR